MSGENSTMISMVVINGAVISKEIQTRKVLIRVIGDETKFVNNF